MPPRAVNPSAAGPAAPNKSGAATTSSTGQGATNSNYLKECREDNPEPDAQADQQQSVSLSNCKITTPLDRLATDQPFEMSIEATTPAKQASGEVTFRLFCTVPAGNGPGTSEDQSATFSGKVSEGVAKATGKLLSPKQPVEPGSKLQYHVVAEHPEAKEKCESPKVEVEAGKTPKPLAAWSLGAVHFGFDSSFILPSAAEKLADFKTVLAQYPGSAVAIFGHADPVGEDENNKGLAGRRAFAVLCLLTKDTEGWTKLANSDKWDLRSTQSMLSHLKDKNSGTPYYDGGIDGKTGPKTESAIKGFRKDNGLGAGSALDGAAKESLFKAYMESVCETTCKPDDFVGDPQDTKRQWACVGCGEFNPVLVFGKSDDDKFRAASDKSERNTKNSVNRRATVFLFPASAKGPGNVQFPCPAWSEGTAKCKNQFFPDGDARRNPSDAERTWDADKNTFACKFYAELSPQEKPGGDDGGNGELPDYDPGTVGDFESGCCSDYPVPGSAAGSRKLEISVHTNNDTDAEQVIEFKLSSTSTPYVGTCEISTAEGAAPAETRIEFADAPTGDKFRLEARIQGKEPYLIADEWSPQEAPSHA